MNKYNLGFISDEDVYNRLKASVLEVGFKDYPLDIDCIHLHLLKSIRNKRIISIEGFDIVDEEQKIYSLLKTNTTTMKRNEKRKVMIKLFDKLLKDPDAQCYVVNLTDDLPKDDIWVYEANGQVYQNKRIHHVSINTFYDVVLGEKGYYQKVYNILPSILADVNKELN